MIRQFTKDFRIIQNADRLAERIFLTVTFAFIGFILFASLVGPSPKYQLTSSALMRLISMPALDNAYAYHDLEDISSNVLFYIPLGLFLSFTVSFRRPHLLTPWLAAGFLLSAVIEVSQYFVGRYPDPMDLITNSAGFIFGFEIGVFAIKYFGLRPSAVIGINQDDLTSTKLNAIASIRFFYIAVYLVSSFVPFDISFDPGSIYGKLHPDRFGQMRLILDPSYHLNRWGHDAHTVCGLLLGILPVGILSAVMAGFRRKLNLASPVFTCFLLAVAAEIGQLFVISRVSDVVMVPVAITAGVVGWLFAQVWFMLQESPGESFFKNIEERNQFLLWLITGYVFLLVLSTLAPYRFEYSLRAVLQKLMYQSNWMPFKAHFVVHTVDNIFAILRGVGAFIPLGLFLTFSLRVYRPLVSRPWVIVIVGLAAAVLAMVLELFKVMDVGYYCDITYVILAGVGGVVGSVLFRLLTRSF